MGKDINQNISLQKDNKSTASRKIDLNDLLAGVDWWKTIGCNVPVDEETNCSSSHPAFDTISL